MSQNSSFELRRAADASQSQYVLSQSAFGSSQGVSQPQMSVKGAEQPVVARVERLLSVIEDINQDLRALEDGVNRVALQQTQADATQRSEVHDILASCHTMHSTLFINLDDILSLFPR